MREIKSKSTRTAAGIMVATLLACLLYALPVLGFDVAATELPPKLLQALQRIDHEKYRIVPQPQQYDYRTSARAELQGWSSFRERYPGDWRVEIDSRSGAPLIIEGQGIPLLPGSANSLRAPALGTGRKPAGAELTISDVSAATDAYLEQNAGMLRVRSEELVLDERKSVGFGRNNRFWSVRYQQVYRDRSLGLIPVRESHVFLRISHGNLIQFGNQLVVTPRGIDTGNVISRAQAARSSTP